MTVGFTALLVNLKAIRLVPIYPSRKVRGVPNGEVFTFDRAMVHLPVFGLIDISILETAEGFGLFPGRREIKIMCINLVGDTDYK